MKMMALRLALWAAIVAAALPVLGQEHAFRGVSDALTGGERRTWVLERFEQFMEYDETCAQGEHWIFQTTGEVLIEKCVDGKVQRESKPYVLLPAEDIDPRLLLDEQIYAIIFYETDEWIEMTLREWAESKASRPSIASSASSPTRPWTRQPSVFGMLCWGS